MNQEPPKKKKVKIEVNKIMNPSDFEERKITTKYHTNLLGITPESHG